MRNFWSQLAPRNRIALPILLAGLLLSVASLIFAIVEGDVGQLIFRLVYTVLLVVGAVVVVVSLRRAQRR